MWQKRYLKGTESKNTTRKTLDQRKNKEMRGTKEKKHIVNKKKLLFRCVNYEVTDM